MWGAALGGEFWLKKEGPGWNFYTLEVCREKSLEVALGDLGWDWALWVGKSFLTWTEGVESVQSRDTRMEKGLRALRDLCDQGGARSGKDPSPRGCQSSRSVRTPLPGWDFGLCEQEKDDPAGSLPTQRIP